MINSMIEIIIISRISKEEILIVSLYRFFIFNRYLTTNHQVIYNVKNVFVSGNSIHSLTLVYNYSNTSNADKLIFLNYNLIVKEFYLIHKGVEHATIKYQKIGAINIGLHHCYFIHNHSS